MRLPANKTEALRLLKRTAIGGFALVPRTIVLGNVVRLRAQYVPKVVQLDPEDGNDVMGISYTRMLKRVIRLEGWKGLLRGIVPLTVAAVFASLWCLPLSYRCAVAPFHPILDVIIRYCVLVLFDVPFTIFFVRSITTPEMLPFFGIHRAVRTLLSPAERHRPWRLYLTPGLLLVIVLEHAWNTLLIPVLIKLVTRHTPEMRITYEITLRTLARISLVFFHSAIFGPLEVIKVRLAVQRYEQPVVLPDGQHDGAGTGDITDSVEPSDVVATRVVRLRTDSEQPAYTSFFDCVRSIMSEEGFETFYCAWWYTLLVALFKAGMIQG